MNDTNSKDFGGKFFDAIGKLLVGYLLAKWGIADPIIELEECIERKEWFKGIVLSTTFFEAIGKRVLMDALKDKIPSNRLENLRLEQVIIFLFSIEKIDQSMYSKMMEVRKFRNNLVHLDPFKKPKIQPQIAKKMMENAIDCISLLIEEWMKSEENIHQFLSELEENDKTKNKQEIKPLEEIEDTKQNKPDVKDASD